MDIAAEICPRICVDMFEELQPVMTELEKRISKATSTSFVGRADMYMKDGLHLSGKGAAVFADKLSAAVDSDLGTMTNIFGSKHCLN